MLGKRSGNDKLRIAVAIWWHDRKMGMSLFGNKHCLRADRGSERVVGFVMVEKKLMSVRQVSVERSVLVYFSFGGRTEVVGSL